MANSSSKTRRFKCLWCDKRFTKADMVPHIDEVHEDLIPEGYSALRVVFNYLNKYPMDYNGKCTECGGPTRWDEKKGRYDRQCQNPKCKESYIRKFEENMRRKRGVTRISSTPEGQEKMLANRKISGVYKFQNGAEKTYTGKYELHTLEFMDKVMNLNPDDIMAPGPVLGYNYQNQKHFYITDFYYQPYNLVIEVKDGGKNPNKRDMPEYRAKQIAKEEFIIKRTNYNYIRLTDDNLSQLLAVFMDLKMQLVDHTENRVIHINEAMNALTSGYLPGMKDSGSVYVVNYLQNNVFSGEQEPGFGISDNPKLTNLICRNKEGRLKKAPDDFLESCEYEVYYVPGISIEEISSRLAPYMDCVVSEGFLYETVFHKKLYSYDQIQLESNAIPVLKFSDQMSLIENITKNLILNPSKSRNFISIAENKDGFNYYIDPSTGEYLIESYISPDFKVSISLNNFKYVKDFLGDYMTTGGNYHG